MEKNYRENDDLREYCEYYVNSMEINSNFKPLIVDILMRRAYEFSLSTGDIQQDMNSLLNNLKKISVGKMPKELPNAAGCYKPADKEIVISSKYIKQFNNGEIPYDVLYEIFTHELYHVLSTDENGRDRLTSINRFTNEYNNSLLEAIVEKAADRCVFSRRGQFAPYYAQNVFGYSNITFITDALEATYGVTEKAFLKHAIMGRERLMSFLSSVANEPIEETRHFFDAIEMNYSRLHGALYNKTQRGVDISNEIKDSMTDIYMLCESKMQARIKNKTISDLQYAKFTVEKLKYEHNRLYYVMQYAAEKFSNQQNDPSIEQDIDASVIDIRKKTMTIINDIDQVTINAGNFPSKAEALRLIKWAQHGNLANYGTDRLAEYGINQELPNSFILSKDVINVHMNMDFSEDSWRNDIIYSQINEAARSSSTNSFVSLIIDRMKKTFQKEELIPLLGTQETNTQRNQNAFGALSEEELKKFNERIQETLKNSQTSKEESEINIQDKDDDYEK